MQWLLTAVAVVAILGGFVLYLLAVFRFYRRLQRKVTVRGYKSQVVLTGAGAAAFLLTFALAAFAVLLAGTDSAIWWILLIVPAAPLVLSPLSRMLPHRNPRTAGPRQTRFPYRVAGWALLFLAPVVWITAIALEAGGLAGFGAACAAGGLACFSIARRSQLPEASSVLLHDARAPVLYLRAFEKESEPFVRASGGPRTLLREIGRSIITREQWWSKTLEAYLEAELTRQIGPFVALGNPGDFVPPERGAARVYVADETWKQQLDEWLQRAAAILVVPEVSQNVGWELRRVVDLGYTRRLFILTRSRLTHRGLPDWQEFARLLSQSGFRGCEISPGWGSVAAFDADQTLRVLGRNIKTAAETVGLIARRLQTREGLSKRHDTLQ